MNSKQFNEEFNQVMELLLGPQGANQFSTKLPLQPTYILNKTKLPVTTSSWIPKANYDPVNKPSHYNQHGIEAIQAIEASMSPEEFKGYLKGNFEKYAWRYTYKGKPLEDLKKAEWYLKKLIEHVQKEMS